LVSSHHHGYHLWTRVSLAPAAQLLVQLQLRFTARMVHWGWAAATNLAGLWRMALANLVAAVACHGS